MSVFSSGLSRLRNSFRRKSGRLSESRGKNGPIVTKESSKSIRTEHSSSKHASSKKKHASTSSHETSRAAASSQGHDGHSPQTNHGERSHSGGDRAAFSPHTVSHGLTSSSDSAQGKTSSLEAKGSTEHPPDADDTDGDSESHYDEVTHESTPDDETVAGVPADLSESGEPPPGHVDDTCPHASPSLESSTSSLTTTNRPTSKTDSVQDMGRSDNSLVADTKPSGTSHRNSASSSGSLIVNSDSGSAVDVVSKCGETNESEVGADTTRVGDVRDEDSSSTTGHVDPCDKGSRPSSTGPMIESDGSYETLPFADAFDRILDPTDLDSRGHDGKANDATPGNSSSAAVTSDPEPSTPTLRTKSSSNSSSNRVSFGTNLQEVLGKAEDARDGILSGSENNPPACEIPQTLKESPSLLALHKNPMEDITCRVCNELFRHPRILPCLHTFCSGCITNLQTYPSNLVEERSNVSKEPEPRELLSPSPVQDSTSSSSFSQKSGSSRRSSEFYSLYEDQNGKADSDRVVLCPTCLKETKVSGTLDELPRNFVVERRVAHYESTHRGVVRQECDSCGDHGNSSVITARCVDCAENLCSLCELSHRRQKKTKRHQVLDIMSASDYLPSQGPGISSHENPRSSASANRKKGKNHVPMRAPPCRQIFCGLHGEEELKLYCLSCDLPVCRDCVVMDHRDHDCQFLSKELFKGQMSEVQQLIRSVVPRITSVDQQLRRVAEIQEHIRSRAEEVTCEVQTYMDRFVSAIEQHRQQLLQQVAGVVEEKQHALHVTERHLRQVRADVEQTCRFVSDLIENASDVEILSVKRLVTERLTGLQAVSASQHQAVSSFMRFAPAETGEVINNFQMYGRVLSRRASAAASSLFSEGLSTARVGHESSVVLCVNSEDGAQYNGKDVQIKAWLIFQNQSIRSFPVTVTLQKNGSYSLKFTPVQSGSHFLHVAVDGQPVKESPFKFKVKGQWRQHKGAWHCCTVCATGGRLDVPCACRGVMPGGQNQGCSHGEPGHPGGPHWSCCGKMVKSSECSGMPVPCMSPVRQVTL